MFSSDATRDIIVNAKASIAASLPAPYAAAQPDSAQLTARDTQLKNPKDAARLSAPAGQTPGVRSVTTVAVAPTREEITTAYQSAKFLTRAKSLLAAGDIPSARLLLERAADAQDAGAALMLARTYDPAVLGTQDARNIIPDPAIARAWYQKAAQLGSSDAQRRLAQLQN